MKTALTGAVKTMCDYQTAVYTQISK